MKKNYIKLIIAHGASFYRRYSSLLLDSFWRLTSSTRSLNLFAFSPHILMAGGGHKTTAVSLRSFSSTSFLSSISKNSYTNDNLNIIKDSKEGTKLFNFVIFKEMDNSDYLNRLIVDPSITFIKFDEDKNEGTCAFFIPFRFKYMKVLNGFISPDLTDEIHQLYKKGLITAMEEDFIINISVIFSRLSKGNYRICFFIPTNHPKKIVYKCSEPGYKHHLVRGKKEKGWIFNFGVDMWYDGANEMGIKRVVLFCRIFVEEVVRQYVGCYSYEGVYNNVLITIKKNKNNESWSRDTNVMTDCENKRSSVKIQKYSVNCRDKKDETVSSSEQPSHTEGDYKIKNPRKGGVNNEFRNGCSFKGLVNKRLYSTSSWGEGNKRVELAGHFGVTEIKKYYSTGKIGFTKENITIKYFDYDSIKDYDQFRFKLVNVIRPGNKYAFLLKLKRDDGGWGMGSKHITYLFDSSNYESILNKLHEKLVEIVEIYIEDYNYCGLDLIMLMLIPVKRLADLELENINKLHLDKNLIKIGETKRSFNNLILPLTMNDNYYGNKLQKKVNVKSLISEVQVNGKNILPLIEENSKLVNKDIKGAENDTTGYDLNFYEYINKKSHKYIIVLKVINSKLHFVEVFDLYGNNLVLAKDVRFTSSLNNNDFKREIGKFSLSIQNNKIVKYEVNDTLPYIRPINPNFKSSRNINIGSFDIETYFDSTDNKSYVYALGYKTLEGDKNLFYISNHHNSSDLVLNCINSMLLRKYNKFIFFVHNLGGFDVVFILSALIDYNTKNNNYYKLEPIFRDDRIIKLSVSIKTKSGVIKISFVDSYNLLNHSLDALSKNFECEQIKGKFPYTFVNKDTLNYIGKTPDMYYYNNIDKEEYNSIKQSNWNLKEETLKYLDNDLNILLEIMDKFNKYCFKTYDLEITNCLTTSRLGVNLIRTKYLNEKIPLIRKPTIYEFVKRGYYGGITEVYKPYGENLYYYDVNSEYPYVSKNKIPGHKYTYMEDIVGNGLNLDDLFGFFYCKVKTQNDYLGLLPMHSNGSLILPNGEFYGVWFSEELKFARDNGYEITVIKGYKFNIVHKVFDKFVDELYKIRSNSKGMIKTVTKLLLNSPFGRFGMNINKAKFEIVDKNKLDYILSTHEVHGIKEMNKNNFIVSYNSEISKDTCYSSGLDYIKVLESEGAKDSEIDQKVEDVSITTAAAITAYARIYINSIKLYVLNNGGKLYYSDTDSIVTDIKLPDNMLGPNLGQLKLEYNVKKAYFITSKTYMLELRDGELIKKAKGVYANTLKKSDFENMYYNKLDVKAMKGDTLISFEKGTVNIANKEAILKHNAYTKRNKVYENNIWVDTLPLWINKKSDGSYDLNSLGENNYIKSSTSLVLWSALYNKKAIVRYSPTVLSLIIYSPSVLALIIYSPSVLALIIYFPSPRPSLDLIRVSSFIGYSLPRGALKRIFKHGYENVVNWYVHESQMIVGNMCEIYIYRMTGILYRGNQGTMFYFSGKGSKTKLIYLRIGKIWQNPSLKIINGYLYIQKGEKYIKTIPR